ncbi:hypothetical protein CLHUN_22500 [Ruminiclostridium hungatei]|uniref:DUF1638 domain-containing protein n=1 Tax=Ruminiclostridium hungatei TaxID=48256 RepID=A0A1V4SIS8_RUMHU|nr:DUF1638 domain-containing protein [Ruminiclostridium hungatei]OPX43770.1 hypothetical protein CLHUN_22500 [Ruminiclostridium hungatei]
MLRLKIIACDVLNRELSYLAGLSQHYTDITFLHQGLHDKPDFLRESLQEEINRANDGFPYNYLGTCPAYDYIIIAYGLCSNGTAGISSPKVPLVIPRAHDCITLLLGSREKYMEFFKKHPGTYWFSSGWIERAWQPSELKFSVLYKDYSQRYGEENAQYLMEMEQTWMKEYKNAGFIRWDSLNNNDYYRSFTRNTADFFKWDYMEFEGGMGLLWNILNGEFKSDEVLILQPGEVVCASYDKEIIKAQLSGEE